MNSCVIETDPECGVSENSLTEKLVALSWQNISFAENKSIFQNIFNKIFGGKSLAPILDNLCGSINVGELTALVGPSGAGKSTLLKCLTKGKTHTGFSGKIFYYGSESSVDGLKASFLTQDESDHLFKSLTVVETLRYACKLKNTTSGTVDIEGIIDNIILKLDLTEVRNNFVENCSGGQRKRLAIGLELCALEKPKFLLLDEPTSGLDSFAGHHVVKLLRKLAVEENISIIATIHQPSFKILSLFHHIFVLTKGGYCIYNGPPRELAHQINQVAPNRVRNFENPADVIVEIASRANRESFPTSTVDDSLENIPHEISNEDVHICSQMVDVEKKSWMRHNFEGGDRNSLEIQENGLCKNSAKFRFPLLWTLLCRTCKVSIWRQHGFILIRLVLHAIVACVLAMLYDSDIGKDDGCLPIIPDPMNCSCFPTPQNETQETAGPMPNVKFQFFSLLFLMFAAIMPTVLTFPGEIMVFLNEHRNGWYTTSSYYISKTIAEIPCQFLFPFLYTFFLYWYSGQTGFVHWYDSFFMSWRYANFLAITILSCFIAQGLGFVIGIFAVKSMNTAIVVSSSVLLFLFLFSGFFVKIPEMTNIARLITDFSFIRFSFESLLIILYGFGRCDVAGVRIGGQNTNRSIVLDLFHLTDSDLWTNICWLIAHLIILRIIAFIALKARAEPTFRLPHFNRRKRSIAGTRNSEIPYGRLSESSTNLRGDRNR